MDSQQIPLALGLRDDATFENFYAPDSLRLLRKTLQDFVLDNTEDMVLVHGAQGSGKSHVLQAVCHLANSLDKSAIYLPLAELVAYPPEEVLEGVDSFDFICLDDVDMIRVSPAWQEAIFHLYNRRYDALKPLYFSSAQAAAFLEFSLKDLKSRLTAVLSFQLPQLDDDDKKKLLQHRAGLRGMEINDACAQYIIQRSGREIPSLIEVIEVLDRATIAASKKVTVPFIKSTFGW